MSCIHSLYWSYFPLTKGEVTNLREGEWASSWVDFVESFSEERRAAQGVGRGPIEPEGRKAKSLLIIGTKRPTELAIRQILNQVDPKLMPELFQVVDRDPTGVQMMQKLQYDIEGNETLRNRHERRRAQKANRHRA